MKSFYINVYNKYSIFGIIIIISFFNVEIDNKLLNIQRISSSGEYFVILDNGIYIYDYNITQCLKFHSFSNNNNDKASISEFISNDKNYIAFLINYYLYIYNSSNYEISYFYLKDLPEDKYESYDVILYDVQDNNFFFIISLIQSNLLSTKNIKYLYYKINYYSSKVINENSKKFEDGKKISEIKPSCHIFSPKVLRC